MKQHTPKIVTVITVLSFLGTMVSCYAMLFGATMDWLDALMMMSSSLIFIVSLTLHKA